MSVKNFAPTVLIALFLNLLISLPGVESAVAAPGTLTESFTNSTLVNPDKWVASSTGNTGVHPCLTARSNSSSSIGLALGTSIVGCGNSPDSAGSGGLILTTAGAGQTATMLYNSPLPTSGGLDIAFYEAQYGGSAADGISFFTKDGSLSDTTTGVAGGGLGYKGLPGGLFGVGIDRFGNWLNSSGSMDSGCTNPGQTSMALAIRGPDTSVGKTGASGFCVLPGGNAGSIGSAYFGTGADTRQSAARPVRIIVDPATDVAPKIRVYMWTSGAPTQDTTTAGVSIVVDEPALYKSANTFKFGFSASTGGANDFHAVWGLSIAPVVALSSPTMYVVPTSETITQGGTPTYAYNLFSDSGHTSSLLASSLSNFVAPTCSSSYTVSTSGPTTLTVSCSGGDAALYNTDQSATAALNVLGLTARTLDFSHTSYSNYYGDTLTVSASASVGTGTVTYSISSGACAVNAASGLVSLNQSVGTCSVNASITSDGTYAAESATATANITVAPKPITITPTATSNSKRVGDADPVFSWRVAGLIGSDTFTATDTFTASGSYASTTPPSAVGVYWISAYPATFTSGSSGNYAISYANIRYEIQSAVVINNSNSAPDPVQTDRIISMDPIIGPTTGGIVATITGIFPRPISGIRIDGINFPNSNWSQTATTVVLMMPAHDISTVSIQLYDGALPLLDLQHFTYIAPVETTTPTQESPPQNQPVVDSQPSPVVTPLATPSKVGRIFFSYNSAQLNKQSLLAIALLQIPSKAHVTIQGFAQPTLHEDDLRISLDRALNVRSVLKKKFPSAVFEVVGMGAKVKSLCATAINKCAVVTIR